MKFRRFLAMCLVVVMVLTLNACSSGSKDSGNSSAQGESKAKKVKIVVMPKVVGIDYYNAVQKGVKKAQEELKDVADITWQGPTEGQVDKQIEMLETIIPTKPDVIAVAANDSEAIIPVLKKASEAGIKVVTWDGDANFRDFFVNLVDYDIFGSAIINSMAEQIGQEGKIAIITTTFTAPNQVLWIDAIKKTMQEKYPKIEIVDTRAAGEDTQKANQLAKDLIKTVPDLKGIIALGAPNLPGALDAVKEAGKTGKIIVCGNSTPNIVKSYLKDGSIKNVQLWNAPDHGYLTCYAAYELVKNGLKDGQAFKAGGLGEFTPKKDKISISINLPLIEFTKENIDNFDF